MKNSPPNTPPNSPSEQSLALITRLKKWAQRPSTIALSVTTLAIVSVGYFGGMFWLERNLPSLVEAQLSKILKREVQVGEVESFSLTGVKLGSSSIPTTPTNPDRVTIDSIKINFNLLPLILRRYLPVQMTLVDVDAYLDQDETGEWIDLELEQSDPPNLTVDTTVRVKNGKVTLLPNGATTPLTFQLNGSINSLLFEENGPLKYDVKANLSTGEAEIKGQTWLETGQTKASARVQDLSLPQLSQSIPNLPVRLSSGELDANLDFSLPSWQEMPSVLGTVTLAAVEAQAENLPAPIQASTLLRFQGQKLLIEETQGSYGNLIASAAGVVDWAKDLDLAVNLQVASLEKLGKNVPVTVGVPIDGEILAKLQVQNLRSNPEIIGTISSQKVTRIDKLELAEIKADFAGDTEEIFLTDFLVKPVAGGEITGRGKAKLASQPEEETEQKIPLSFNFKASLPADAIAAPYNLLPPEVTLGQLTAQAQIQGTLQQPAASLQWQANQAKVSSIGQVSGTGEVLLGKDNTILLRNTKLQIGEGTILASGKGNLKTNKWLASVDAASVPLEPFLPENLQNIASLSRAKLNLSGSLNSFDLNSIQANGQARLGVAGGSVRGRGQLKAGIFNALANVSQIQLSQLGTPVPVTLQGGQIRLSGQLNSLKPETIQAVADLRLAVEGGTVRARSRLDSGVVSVAANAGGIKLNQLVPTLKEPTTLVSSQVNLTGSLKELFPAESPPNLNSLQANFQGRLGVAKGRVDARGNLNQGTLRVAADASQVQLANFVEQLDAQVSGKVAAVSKLNNNFDLPTLLNQTALNADLQAQIAQGTVNVISQLNQGQWQAAIAANQLDTSILSRQLLAEQAQQLPKLPNLNAQLNLSGSVQPLLQPNSAATIQANNVSVQMGEQFLKAKGLVILENLNQQPEISNLTLDVAGRYDSETLPVTQLLAQVVEDEKSLEQINITGAANFQGRLQGKNLISAPLEPGNLNLTGNLRLSDFTVNEIVFEPVLAGGFQVNTGKEIAIDLRGQRDVIAARLEPCTRSGCLAPYLPISFQIRGNGEERPVIARGQRQGDILDVKFQDFDLALLNLAPAVDVGIEGGVSGEVTGELDVNLFTLASAGEFTIDQPGLGYIQAEQFAGNFSFQDGVAKLTSAALNLGESTYKLENAGINLNSGQLQGKLLIDQGYVQDILTTFGWSSWQDLARGIKSPQALGYANAAAVPIDQVGSSNNNLVEQLRLLAAIQAKLQERLAARQEAQAVGIPETIDLQGSYTGEVNLAGTLTNPLVNFDIQGKDWLWVLQQHKDSQESDESISPPERAILVDQIIAQGSLREGTIELEPLQLQLSEAIIVFQGELSEQQENGQFRIENLPLSLARNFVEIPVDLQGKFNAKGDVRGSLENPQIQEGEIAFVEASINCGSIVEIAEQENANCQQLEPIIGQFNYANSRLQFNTTEPSYIQVNAVVPYPLTPGENDQLQLDVRLGTEAIALVEPLTQGNVQWVDGEGEVRLAVQSPFNLAENSPEEVVKDLVARATGQVILEDATLKAAALEEPLNLNGQIALDNQRLKVNDLTGNFAQTNLSVAGVLPLFLPLRSNDPDYSNPLTVAIERGELNLEGLYDGEVEAGVIVTGSALNPVVGGEVGLYNGRAFVPESEKEDNDTILADAEVDSEGVATSEDVTTNREPFIVPRFNDFRVVLDRFKISQSPLYKFRVAGDVTVNGSLDKLENLRPEGIITLQRGEIDVLSSQFFLTRAYEHQVVFEPEQGLLNPYLDVRLGTVVSQSPDQLRLEPRETEIREDLVTSARPEQIKITLRVQGRASQLTGLGLRENDDCKTIQEQTTLIETGSSLYTSRELQRLENCIHQAVLGTGSNLELLNTPVVSLSSTPPRNEAEILALLGNEFLALASQLEQNVTKGEAEELAEFAVRRFVVEPALNNVIFTVEDWVSSVGRKVGLTDLRVYPVFEGIRQVGEESSVSLSYDYEFNEVQIKYQTRF
ncbi:MAG: translocation/assembly module TamB domain-containing protein [Coleofasciculaceae cyanobacterium]